jgi:hypothetical protein
MTSFWPSPLAIVRTWLVICQVRVAEDSMRIASTSLQAIRVLPGGPTTIKPGAIVTVALT